MKLGSKNGTTNIYLRYRFGKIMIYLRSEKIQHNNVILRLKEKDKMQHLSIFENQKLAKIENASDLIVEKLSDNYRLIIDNMVGKSEKTKITYKGNVEHFLDFIQNEGINSMSFGEYRNALEKVERLSPKTKNAYLSAAKALLKEALKYGLLPVNITANVPQFKIPTGHTKDGVQESELYKILATIKKIKRTSTRLKMLAFFHLFAGEGLRQMEAQQIKMEDINFEDKSLMICGKGSDDKANHLCLTSTMEALHAYLIYIGVESGYIFPSKQKPGLPISLRAIRKFFTERKYGIFAKTGVNGRSVHGFRHFFATKTLDVFNGDLHKAKRRTRHRNVQTLQIYDDRRLSKLDMEILEVAFRI